MSSTSNPRKRPAPDSQPIAAAPQPAQQSFPSPITDLPPWGWNTSQSGLSMSDPAARAAAQYSAMSAATQMAQAQGNGPASTALARRPPNRALVPNVNRTALDQNSEFWQNYDESSLVPAGNGQVEETDDVDVLEERALQAKRDAQANRKQIPPFVQKLSSFLDESKNTDLIRWSDSGDSFIVLDEEEFAKKLIPELFKHNNYASFVRQLNMYGFHKRVGLSDNSMKASERKNKSPSEYWNPYFRRGHPNLLWLINKPKSTSSKKKGKKEDGEPDDEEEVDVEDMQAAQGYATVPGQASNPSAQGEVGPLQSRQVAAIKTQLDMLQQQQKVISDSITRMRRENTAMLEQALAFQNMHERHENSINAILNFLANVFRKSLEDQGGAQNVQDLLASIIPGAGGQPPIPQGSVFEMPDLSNQSGGMGGVAMSPPKRQQRLLMPIPTQGRASTVTPSSSGTSAQTPFNPPTGSVTELFDTSPADSATPNFIHQELQTNPQEGMMRIINDTNANANSTINLPDMANNTAASLSNDQRNQMLRAMAGDAGGTPAMPFLQPDGVSAALSNAGASPGNANLSLSPLTKSAVPPPSLHDIANRTTELEQLEKLQTEQAAKLSELSSYLSPLSPSGRIPGLDDNGYFDNNIDLDQFVDPNAFNDLNYTGNDFTSAGDGNGFGNYDFSALTSAADEGAPTTTATAPATDLTLLNSNNLTADTPSEAATEEIPRDDLDSPERESKRQRRT